MITQSPTILETTDNRLFRVVESNGVTFTSVAVRKVRGAYVDRADCDPRRLRVAGCRVVAEGERV